MSDLPRDIEDQLRAAANEFFADELEDLKSQRDSVKELIDQLRTNLDFLKQIVPGQEEETAEVVEEVSEETVDAPEDGVIEVAGEGDEVSTVDEDEEDIVYPGDEEDAVEEAVIEEVEVAEEPVAEVEEVVAPAETPAETPESLGLEKQVFTPEEDLNKVSEDEAVNDTDTVLDSSTETETEE
jgi:predicted CopG family antitoxin